MHAQLLQSVSDFATLGAIVHLSDRQNQSESNRI